MKVLSFLYLLMLGLSSCQSYQNISKGKAITEANIRTMLRTGESYKIELNYGKELEIDVTHIDSVNVYGIEKVKANSGKLTQQPYRDSYSNLVDYATRFSEKKFNAWITIGVIVIPVGLIFGAILHSSTYVY